MIDTARTLELMDEAIAESKLSVFEDDRAHPYVGAVLTDASGTILVRAHREPGVHAEAALIRDAKKAKIDLSTTVLFVTLEPCTDRGKTDVPCVILIERAKIPLVYIGTLDPNPDMERRTSRTSRK